MLQPAQVNAAARFSKFKTCEECVAAGLGWSEAKKKCGGYATKTCRSVPSPKQKKKKKTKNSIKQSAHLEQRSVPEDDNSDIVLKDILARMKVRLNCTPMLALSWPPFFRVFIGYLCRTRHGTLAACA